MKTYRLDQLADGIFAIIMTLLALDIRVPVIAGEINDTSLWHAVNGMSVIFLTFAVSFALLFTYWRAHHSIVSIYAKNLTAGLANYNALFFLLIALVPFSSKFLSDYSGARVPIIIYGVNVILIGLTLYFMRRYIEISPTIDTVPTSRDEMGGSYVRILLPVFASLAAMILSFWNLYLPIFLFAAAILFNLVPGTSTWIYHHFSGKHKD